VLSMVQTVTGRAFVSVLSRMPCLVWSFCVVFVVASLCRQLNQRLYTLCTSVMDGKDHRLLSHISQWKAQQVSTRCLLFTQWKGN